MKVIEFNRDEMMYPISNGYIALNSVSGGEVVVANSARISFDKYVDELSEQDVRLIHYLIRHKHFSTLRHNFISFTVHMPLFVARQLQRYTIGSNFGKDFGWNEVSRRYVETEPEFWELNTFRKRSKSNKQGSGENFSEDDNEVLLRMMAQHEKTTLQLYNFYLSNGVAPEQARMVLPMSLMTTVMWSMSLQTLLHFLRERLESTTQKETMWYAIGAYHLTKPFFPNVFNASEIKLEE